MLTLTAADCRFIVTLAGQNCRFTLTRDTQAAKSCGYDGCDEGPPYFAAHMENARNPDVIIPVCHLHHKREAAAGYVVMRAGTGVKAVPGPLC